VILLFSLAIEWLKRKGQARRLRAASRSVEMHGLRDAFGQRPIPCSSAVGWSNDRT
jgi:hypothetical protein